MQESNRRASESHEAKDKDKRRRKKKRVTSTASSDDSGEGSSDDDDEEEAFGLVGLKPGGGIFALIESHPIPGRNRFGRTASHNGADRVGRLWDHNVRPS